jgi:hypothetical protein
MHIHAASVARVDQLVAQHSVQVVGHALAGWKRGRQQNNCLGNLWTLRGHPGILAGAAVCCVWPAGWRALQEGAGAPSVPSRPVLSPCCSRCCTSVLIRRTPCATMTAGAQPRTARSANSAAPRSGRAGSGTLPSAPAAGIRTSGAASATISHTVVRVGAARWQRHATTALASSTTTLRVRRQARMMMPGYLHLLDSHYEGYQDDVSTSHL